MSTARPTRRTATAADLSEVLALAQASDVALIGESDWTEADLREEWEDYDLERDVLLLELDGRLAGYAAGHGYAPARHFWRMVIDLERAPEPVVPDGIELRLLREPEERRALHETLEESFEDHWEHRPRSFEEWSKNVFEVEGYDPTLVWVALEREELVAANVCYWKRHGEWGWVGILGVRRPWRRRGIAEALLETAFAEFFRRGERRVALGVDAQSPTGATRLYEKAGMRVFWEAVVYEKELRPG